MEKFDRLANRNTLEETKDQQVSKFVQGLRVSIRDQVSLQTLYTLNEVVTLAKKIEYQHLKVGLKFSNYNLEPSNSTTNPCLHHDHNLWLLGRIVVLIIPQWQ